MGEEKERMQIIAITVDQFKIKSTIFADFYSLSVYMHVFLHIYTYLYYIYTYICIYIL